MSRIEPFINNQLLDLVMQAKLEELGDDVGIEAKEQRKARDLSELYRIVSNYDEDEMMVCAAAMLEKDATVYPRVQIAERKLLRKGNRNNDRDSD